MFDSIDFYFPSDANIERVRAGRTPDGRRAVEVSNGFLNFSSMIVQAVVFSATNADSRGDDMLWTDYISYLSSSLKNRAEPVSPTAVAVSVLPYHTWAGIPDETFAKFLNENQDGLKALLLDAFVFALLHEVGHHVLDHPPTNAISAERSREQEWAADLYAISGIARLRQSSLGAIPYFLFSIELQGVVEAPNGSHDPAICRAHYLMDKNSSSELMRRLRQSAAEACGRHIAQMDAAFDSTDRTVCYRPTALPK